MKKTEMTIKQIVDKLVELGYSLEWIFKNSQEASKSGGKKNFTKNQQIALEAFARMKEQNAK